jgi:hypothetical protein
MKREQLEHVLRAVSRIVPEGEVLVIGSQSVLGSIQDDRLPAEATASMEVDIAFLDDRGEEKSDLVDGAIGELSAFHDTFGYYAQGVSVSTAVLPAGWRARVVRLQSPRTYPGHGLCLEPHDCVVSKLVACREKDFAFASALVDAGIIDLDVLEKRIESLEVDARIVDRIRSWIQAQRKVAN